MQSLDEGLQRVSQCLRENSYTYCSPRHHGWAGNQSFIPSNKKVLQGAKILEGWDPP